MNELISVIVPVYNVAPYLKRCLNSILNQTYTNFELIVVDDGSTDDCPKICDEYAAKDSRIRVVHQTNQGLAGARNTGLDIMKGEYISFIDSDDFVADEYLEVLHKALVDNNADYSQCDFQFFENEKKVKNYSDYEIDVFDRMQTLALFTTIQANKSFISSCAKLYKKNLFEDIRFPIGKLYEDAFTNYKIIDKINKIAYVKSSMYNYYQRQGSIMGGSFNEKSMQLIECFMEAKSFFEEKKEFDIAAKFIPPILMRQIYCYWGQKVVLKNDNAAKKIMEDYRRNLKFPNGMKHLKKRWQIVFWMLGRFPVLYLIYRRYSPFLYNGR